MNTTYQYPGRDERAHIQFLLERGLTIRASAYPYFTRPTSPQANEALLLIYLPPSDVGRIHPLIVMARSDRRDYELVRLWSGGFYAVGLTYAPGESLPRDLVEAHKWYTVILTSEGVSSWVLDTATRARKKLAAAMTPEQIAEAKRRADDWNAALNARGIELPNLLR